MTCIQLDINRNNIAMGVKAGMVRSDIDCRAGLDAIKETYPKIAQNNASTGVLHEWYVAQYLKSQYLERLNSKVDDLWKTKHSGQSVQEAIKEALVKGFGEPVLSLIHYLEYEHSRHCLPIKVASGLANLPVDYVYTDGVPDVKNKTKKVLPGTARELNGTKTYSMILSYFTTTNISAETIYQEGRKQLKTLMPKVGLFSFGARSKIFVCLRTLFFSHEDAYWFFTRLEVLYNQDMCPLIIDGGHWIIDR